MPSHLILPHHVVVIWIVLDIAMTCVGNRTSYNIHFYRNNAVHSVEVFLHIPDTFHLYLALLFFSVVMGNKCNLLTNGHLYHKPCTKYQCSCGKMVCGWNLCSLHFGFLGYFDKLLVPWHMGSEEGVPSWDIGSEKWVSSWDIGSEKWVSLYFDIEWYIGSEE